MAGFDILNIVGDPWNDAGSQFGGISLSVTDTASNANSKFIEVMLNGAPVYTLSKRGEFYFSNPAGTSLGGMALIGGAGEMALTSMISPNTGLPAQVMRYYWEDPVTQQVAVLRGMGTNRLSIESNGAIVHIANNGRYEFETAHPTVPIQFVGYKASGADGRPFLFNNYAQTAFAESVVQFGVTTPQQTASQWGTFDGTNFKANAYIDGGGNLFARFMLSYGDPGTRRGIGAKSTNEVSTRSFIGMDRDNTGMISFGDGNSAHDTLLCRAGPNLFSIGGGAAADRPAIKGTGTAIQGRLADDSDFCTVQGKITTDQMAVNETITPDSTLTLYDAAGTAYKVPCLAA